MITPRQSVFQRDPIVKDKTFPLPQAFLCGDILKIFQDAPLQVIDFFKTDLFHIGGSFLAPDAAGAVHGHCLRLGGIFRQRIGPVGEGTERTGFRIDSMTEPADADFVIISCVDHHDIVAADQRVPVLRVNIGAGIVCRINPRLAHGDNLRFKPHLHAQEPGRRCRGIFHLKISKTRPAAQVGNYFFNPVGRSGDGAVNPFFCKQKRAANTLF